MPLGILIVNDSFDMKFCNETFENMLKKDQNTSNHELDFFKISNLFTDFIAIDRSHKGKTTNSYDNLQDLLMNSLKFSKTSSHFVCKLKIQKKEKKIEMKIKYLEYNNENCYILLFEDISKKEKILENKKNNQFRNRILSSFSHELRTPLNGSIPPLETCIADPNTPPELIENYLIYVLCSLKLLENFLNDIVDFSQIISNEFQLNLEEFVVVDLAKEICKIFEPTVKIKKLKLKLKYLEDIAEVKIKNDPARIKQIVINFISNAIKFTKQGEIAIEIEYYEEEQRFKIAIKDTGIG